MTNSPTLPRSFTPAPQDFELAADLVRSAYQDIESANIVPKWTLAETEAAIAGIDFDDPIGLEGAVQEALALMQNGDLLSASARCFGYFNPTSAWPGVIGDLLASARNPQICVTSHAPASVSMERAVMKLALARLGMEGGTGHFTSGGSEANETALLCALCRAQPDYIEDGISAFTGTPTLYVSADSHLAWIKIAKTTGLGSKAVRLVATSGDGCMDVQALKDMMAADKASGRQPFMIAATCGTTSAGMIDPLAQCHAIAKAEDIHFHVDAAWAGALIFDDSRRGLLGGINLADSVTIDAHKWLSTPMGAGMIMLRTARYAANVFSVQTSYMPDGDGADMYITTNQWSRRFIGLRLWMILRTMGTDGYRAMFARHFALAAYMRKKLPENGWTIRNNSTLPVIVFDDGQSKLDSQAVADALEQRGKVWLGRVNFEGRSVLRACTTSFLSDYADVDLLVAELGIARNKLTKA